MERCLGCHGGAGIRHWGSLTRNMERQSAWGIGHRVKKAKASIFQTLCALLSALCRLRLFSACCASEVNKYQYDLLLIQRRSPIVLPFYVIEEQRCFCFDDAVNLVDFLEDQFIQLIQ
jgi:hypothetical protein